MRRARALSITAVTISVVGSLGCGRLFCVDSDQCWGEPWRDTWEWRDTWREQPTGGEGVIAGFHECADDGSMQVVWEAMGDTFGARVFIGQLEDPGYGEEHESPVQFIGDPSVFQGVLPLKHVDAADEFVAGETTLFECNDEALMSTVTFVVMLDGVYEGPSCAVWGANTDIADSLGCVTF